MRPKDWPDWRIAPSQGDPPKGDETYQRQLATTVEQDPRTLGQQVSTWTCAALAAYQELQTQVRVSAETVRRYLHRLGYGIVRPVLSISSPDPAYRAKAAYLDKLQAWACQGQITLLYEDEVDLNLLPGVIGCWTRRGQQRKVPTPGQNVKRYGFGAVNYLTGQVTRHLGEHKDSLGFIALLQEIVATYCLGPHWQGPPVVLVVDNYIIHRSRKTSQVLAGYADRLCVVALPTYAPHLNVIERLWKHLRRQVTHNHLFASITELIEAVEQFFRDLDGRWAEVRSLIGHPE